MQGRILALAYYQSNLYEIDEISFLPDACRGFHVLHP